MLHVLRVDEDLERASLAADDRVVERDVHRMRARRPFQLVGDPRQRFRPTQRLLGGHAEGVRRRRVLSFWRGRWRRTLCRQDRACDGVRSICCAALAALIIGQPVHGLEFFKGDVLGHVDRLRDRAVDVFLRRRLHGDMRVGLQCLGVHEIRWELGVSAKLLTIQRHGVVNDLLAALTAIWQTHLARVAVGEDRFDSGGDIAGI